MRAWQALLVIVLPVASFAQTPAPMAYKAADGHYQAVTLATPAPGTGQTTVGAYKGPDGWWHAPTVTALICSVDPTGVPLLCGGSVVDTQGASDFTLTATMASDVIGDVQGKATSPQTFAMPANIPTGWTARLFPGPAEGLTLTFNGSTLPGGVLKAGGQGITAINVGSASNAIWQTY